MAGKLTVVQGVTMHWFIDFDDTLAVGPITWALTHVFPRMVQDNHLPYDPDDFTLAVLHAQQKANENESEESILDELFDRLGWPSELKQQLVHDIYNGY